MKSLRKESTKGNVLFSKSSNTAATTVEALLEKARIRINGKDDHDLRIHDERFYHQLLAHGSLGLGESYIDGWWDVKDLSAFFARFLSRNLETEVKPFYMRMQDLKAKLFNMQDKIRSKKVAKIHYDLGNGFYEKMLDKWMQYTCAYWKDATDLAEAQEAKLHLICRKLDLQPGETVLELGCGWGGFARFAAQHYRCKKVVAYNISKEQIDYAKKKSKGLPIEFRLEDYREATGKYDKVVSIGLCEHIGYKNYRTFFELARNCLKDNGLFLVHTIGNAVSQISTDPWLDRYIFPGSLLPSITQLGRAMENLFVMEDWHNFGADYDKTLMAWWKNFDTNWKKRNEEKDRRFYRMWTYYLLSCAGSFRCRKNQLWQIVLSKKGISGTYASVR